MTFLHWTEIQISNFQAHFLKLVCNWSCFLSQENQIALRAAFLERENSTLRNQVQSLNDINEEMKKDVQKLKKNIQDLQQMDQTG